MNIAQAQDSPFTDPVAEDRTVLLQDNYCFKLYSLASFISNQRVQLDLYNEYAITRRAKEKELPNVIQLEGVFTGADHIALCFKEYQMSLRTYL